MIYSKEDLRRDALGKISPAAEDIMNDEKLARYRRPFVRKLLAAALVLSAIGNLFSFSVDGVWSLINLIVMIGLCFLLARVNRGFMDLPQELVDDRIRGRRNEMYRFAYMGVLGILSVIMPTALLLNAFQPGILALIDPVAALLALFWTTAVLPTAAFAWIEREI